MASTVKAGVPAPGGGTTVSFSNAPQAGDDYFDSSATGITEDTTSIIKLNVMGNDLGGAAKSLWSLDDGTANSGTGTNPNGTTYNKDLLTQDQIGATNQSALGAEISITDDGQVAYKLTSTLKNALQHLGAGETTTDSFTYAIRLGNGTLSGAKSTVEIAGTNDEAKITGDVHGGVKEDASALPAGTEGTTETDATQTLAFTDADWHDTHSASVEDGTNLGTLEATVVTDTYTGDGTHYGAGNASTGEIDLAYSVNDSAIDYLGEGQTKVETFTVDLTETHPDHTTSIVKQTVNFTITGTNDDAVFTSSGTGHTAGSVIEDASGTATETTDGTLSFDDVDVIDTHTVTVTPVGTPYGTLTVDHPITDTTDGTGGLLTWHYTVDNSAIQTLGTNDHPVDRFTVKLFDGHSYVTTDIQITVNGAAEVTGPTNHAPVANDDIWIISQQTDANDNVVITPDWFTHNDTDADGNLLYVTNVTLAGGAPLTGNWQPNYDANGHLVDISLNNLGGGDVALDYTLSDGTTSSTGHVAITSQHVSGNADPIDLHASTYDYAWIDGVGGNDGITGGSGVNTLAGGDGGDTLVGGANIDTLIGNGGGDTLTGSALADKFVYLATSDSGGTDKHENPLPVDTITDFTPGTDKIDVSAIDSGAAGGAFTYGSSAATAHGVWYTTDAGANTTTLHFDTDGVTSTDEMTIVLTGSAVGATLTSGDFNL